MILIIILLAILPLISPAQDDNGGSLAVVQDNLVDTLLRDYEAMRLKIMENPDNKSIYFCIFGIRLQPIHNMRIYFFNLDCSFFNHNSLRFKKQECIFAKSISCAFVSFNSLETNLINKYENISISCSLLSLFFIVR